MAIDNQTIESSERGGEFGRGYFLIFGLLAGMFVTVVVTVTVLIVTAPSPEFAPEPTVPVAAGEPGDVANGEELFSQTCAACHGQGGIGIDGDGPRLIGNEFVAGLDHHDLMAFLVAGRPADHPDNERGLAMPPKGGNTSLTDDDIDDIAAFLHTLN